MLGREVAVPESPRRIVSFSPAITETLFMIGLGDAVVGVSAFCARPEAARGKRRVGSYSTVSDELLVELKPDLVLSVTGYQRDFAVRLSSRFPAYPLELPVTVAGIVDLVMKVGLVTGCTTRARELAASLLRAVGSVRKGPALRAYVEIDLGGPVSFGALSYITDAVELLGSSTLFGDRMVEWLTPDLDVVKKSNPDVILYEPKMYSKFGVSDLDGLVKKRGWNSIKARRAGNIFVTPGPLDFLAHHGPSFITEALPWLSRKLEIAAANVAS